MIITKYYSPRMLNFHLLPDLVEQIQSSVPKSMLVDDLDKELRLGLTFRIRTNSQSAEIDSSAEFRDFIRSVTEPIIALDAELKCFFVADHLRNFTDEPSALEFSYRLDSIKIVLARNTAETVKNLFTKIEETFSLESIKPAIKDEEELEYIPERTVFIAHSFDAAGKGYAYELIKFLNLLEFKVSTGEGYSPERVSKKVKSRLMAQEIVIVILSKKDDATWLIQEATGAALADKPLILLIEDGVEFKSGILGDIEYIQFSVGHISSAFVPILEGLQELGYAFHDY